MPVLGEALLGGCFVGSTCGGGGFEGAEGLVAFAFDVALCGFKVLAVEFVGDFEEGLFLWLC